MVLGYFDVAESGNDIGFSKIYRPRKISNRFGLSIEGIFSTDVTKLVRIITTASS